MLTETLSLWLNSGIGPRTLLKLHDYFGSYANILTAPKQQLLELGLAYKVVQAIKNPPQAEIDACLQWQASADYRHIIAWNDVHYPALLRQIASPPAILFIEGDVAILQSTQIGMVGSRQPTPAGRNNAIEFAKNLAAAGLTITSGLALGVDTACHQGALAARQGCKTIAVLGSGLQYLYPRRNYKLAEQIIANQGAIVSELPLKMQALAKNFPRRNRIISGMSLGVLVVEAATQSGSLITARYAMEQNREVYAIPGSIHNPVARGCHQLIKQGAKCVESIADLLEELPLSISEQVTNSNTSNENYSQKLAPTQQKLVSCVDFDPTPIDIIVARSGLAVATMRSVLTELELAGYLTQVPGGYTRIR